MQINNVINFYPHFDLYHQLWEEKLVSMQDILDAMLKCQATWLYLEPIFSSEDIIAQMPEEGRKFRIVDGYWKNIITEAASCLLGCWTCWCWSCPSETGLVSCRR